MKKLTQEKKGMILIAIAATIAGAGGQFFTKYVWPGDNDLNGKTLLAFVGIGVVMGLASGLFGKYVWPKWERPKRYAEQ